MFCLCEVGKNRDLNNDIDATDQTRQQAKSAEDHAQEIGLFVSTEETLAMHQ